MTFLVYDPDTMDPEDGSVVETNFSSPYAYEYAAKQWAEKRHADDDYPERRTVVVRLIATGNEERFEVEARPSVDFYAHRVQP